MAGLDVGFYRVRDALAGVEVVFFCDFPAWEGQFQFLVLLISLIPREIIIAFGAEHYEDVSPFLL